MGGTTQSYQKMATKKLTLVPNSKIEMTKFNYMDFNKVKNRDDDFK